MAKLIRRVTTEEFIAGNEEELDSLDGLPEEQEEDKETEEGDEKCQPERRSRPSSRAKH